MPELIIPEYEAIPTRLFRLRWQFHYHDGRKPKFGIWDGTSQHDADSAWAVDKKNLSLIIVEGEDRLVNIGQTRVLIECPASQYASMQWEAYSRVPGFFKGPGGTPRVYISGLSILTRDEKITAWVNGRVSREELAEHEKQWKIREHTLENN